MTARTPVPKTYPNYNIEAKGDKTEKSYKIDYNGTNTNKAGINQSSDSGRNNTTTIENRPVNRGYRQPKPYENYGSLFATEYIYLPKKREIKQEEPSNNENKGRESYTALERSGKDRKDKAEAVDKRVDDLDLEAAPGAETEMAFDGYRMNELEMRNKQHSAKIHQLERELRNVKMENSQIKGQMVGPGAQNGFNERGGHLDGIPERYESRSNIHPEPRYPETYTGRPDAELQPNPGRRQYENEQHRIAHRHGGPDEEPYWGFNKYYDPQFITAYRREHVPYYAKQEEREKQTQYADDYNYLHEIQRRQEEEWRRKRLEEEELLMKDKPKTYEYTAPYQSLAPPRDINKYFHDTKYLESRPEPKPDEYYFHEEAFYPLHQRTGVSTYERAFISPRYGYTAQAQPGGLYLIRFHDTGFDEVRLSFREQQTLIKTYEGRLLGIARKHNVYAIEGDADWHYSKNQQHRQQVHINYKNVEDAIAVLWFPSKERAIEFCGNHFRNRFQQHNFPTPHSFEAHYIPMLAKPFLRDLDTFLVIEVLNAKKYSPGQIQKFDADTREAILQYMPNSIPFVASTLEGHQTLKPGSTALFRDRTSKVFVSLFGSMSEISDLWEKGIIQYKLAEWNINGPINVWAFALKDWQD